MQTVLTWAGRVALLAVFAVAFAGAIDPHHNAERSVPPADVVEHVAYGYLLTLLTIVSLPGDADLRSGLGDLPVEGPGRQPGRRRGGPRAAGPWPLAEKVDAGPFLRRGGRVRLTSAYQMLTIQPSVRVVWVIPTSTMVVPEPRSRTVSAPTWLTV